MAVKTGLIISASMRVFGPSSGDGMKNAVPLQETAMGLKRAADFLYMTRHIYDEKNRPDGKIDNNVKRETLASLSRLGNAMERVSEGRMKDLTDLLNSACFLSVYLGGTRDQMSSGPIPKTQERWEVVEHLSTKTAGSLYALAEAAAAKEKVDLPSRSAAGQDYEELGGKMVEYCRSIILSLGFREMTESAMKLRTIALTIFYLGHLVSDMAYEAKEFGGFETQIVPSKKSG